MMSMNLIFHIFSAVLAFVLAWYLVRLRSEVRFAKELFAGARGTGKQIKVHVDTPYRFLKRFTGIMGIGFDYDENSESDVALVKIDGSALLRLCLENGVTSMKLVSPAKKQTCLGVASDRTISQAVCEKLAEIFNRKIEIEIISTNK